MLLQEKIEDLQKLTKRKITYEQIAPVLGLGSKQAVQNRITRKQKLKEWEILALDEAFLINSATYTQKFTNVNNQQQFELIQYFPEVYLSAGYGVEVYDETCQTVVIDSQFLISSKGLRINPKYCKMVRVCGNSMWPEYHHGDRVIIDESDKNLTDGQIYAFRYDGQCYVKEINRAGNKIKCISINKDYEPFFIERDIDFQVFGRILPRVRL